MHARRLFCHGLIDGTDSRLGVRRKDKDRVRLASQIDVRDIAPAAGQEARILLAGDGLSDAEADDRSS